MLEQATEASADVAFGLTGPELIVAGGIAAAGIYFAGKAFRAINNKL